MKRLFLIICALVYVGSAYGHAHPDTGGVGPMAVFVENLGQWDAKIRYEVQLNDGAVFVEEDCLTFMLVNRPKHHGDLHTCPKVGHAYKMHFDGAKPTAPSAIGQQPGYHNYYIGDNPQRWRSHVGTFAAVQYYGLYDGIDLEVYAAKDAMKYNFIVAPQADPGQIALRYEGADGVGVTREGNLRIRTSVRDIVESKPYVYQNIDGREVEVEAWWKVEKVKGGEWKVNVEVGEYDAKYELVIDPVLVFSTYTGSVSDNWGTTAAYDSQKNAYTAGLVFGTEYPVSLGAYDMTYNSAYNSTADIGIFKFDSTGSERLFATYLGGAQGDMPHSMFVNSFDELVVFGTTGSSNFPTTENAYCRDFHWGTSVNYGFSGIPYPVGSDLFVSRFSSDGAQLQASTFVGGSGNDGLNYRARYESDLYSGNDSLYYNYGDGARGEIITDDLNNVYIGTTTFSTDFPIVNGIQSSNGGRQDGVVLKLDYNLRTLLWSTYLGGEMDDAVYSIDVDTSYNIVACGGTNSSNFPTTDGSYQPSYGGGSADGFVCKISYNGDRIINSTYIGSERYDQLYFVRIGRHDEVLLFGQTRAPGSTMIYNAGYGVPDAGMLLVRLQPDFSSRVWSTVFGTPGRINLSPTAFAADICTRVYASGWGRDFVGHTVTWNTPNFGTKDMETTVNAVQRYTDGQDFYIISLDADANTLDYATFFGEQHGPASGGGSDHVDGGTSRFDRHATLYQAVCASCTGTQAFPTTANAWSRQNQSTNCNNALFRFNVNDGFPVAEFTPPSVACVDESITFNNIGRGSSYRWDFGDGTTSTEHSPTHTYTVGGRYTVTLIAYLSYGCVVSDTQRHSILVLADQGHTYSPLIACNNNPIQIGPNPQLGATYQWLLGHVSDSSIANPWVNQPGNYILSINGNGCSQSDTFIVQTFNLVDSLQLVSNSCHDTADCSAVLLLGYGISIDSLTVAIDPPCTDQTLGPKEITFSHLQPEVRYHLILSGYGCTYEQDFTIPNKPRPSYQKEYSPHLCNDSCTGWIHLRSVSYDTARGAWGLDTLISGLCAGTHLLSLTDADGCPLVDTTVIDRNHRLDDFHIWPDRHQVYLTQSVQFHSSITDPDLRYSWTPPVDFQQPDIPEPVATPSEGTTLYTCLVTDTITSCSASDTAFIHCSAVICGPPLFIIPNAFSPNNDGINDRLCFNPENIVTFHIVIYNRWGQAVFQTSDINACWDGTFRNQPCLPGVYTYTCSITCHTGIENQFKGDITLIR